MIIYKATNTKNNKIYIGQTTKTLNRRKILHKAQMNRTNIYFHKALRKQFDLFDWEVIETCSTIDELNEREIYWIAFYNSNDPKIGYNLTSGGRNVKRGITKALRKNLLQEEIDFIVEERKNLKTFPQILELVQLKFNAKYKIGVITRVLQENLSKFEYDEIVDKIQAIAAENSIGKAVSDEVKLKASLRMTGKKPSQATIDKIKNSKIGFKHSKESKDLIVAVNGKTIRYSQDEEDKILQLNQNKVSMKDICQYAIDNFNKKCNYGIVYRILKNHNVDFWNAKKPRKKRLR